MVIKNDAEKTFQWLSPSNRIDRRFLYRLIGHGLSRRPAPNSLPAIRCFLPIVDYQGSYEQAGQGFSNLRQSACRRNFFIDDAQCHCLFPPTCDGHRGWSGGSRQQPAKAKSICQSLFSCVQTLPRPNVSFAQCNSSWFCNETMSWCVHDPRPPHDLCCSNMAPIKMRLDHILIELDNRKKASAHGLRTADARIILCLISCRMDVCRSAVNPKYASALWMPAIMRMRKAPGDSTKRS